MERVGPIRTERDCQVTEIPSGLRETLPAGTVITVLQALGGSLTAQTERGTLVRMEERDADALGEKGRELFSHRKTGAGAASSESTEPSDGPLDPMRVWKVLGTVYDPEIPASIVELGLVYLCQVVPLPEGGHQVIIRMTLTAPGCGIGPLLMEEVRSKVAAIPGVTRVEVELVFEPPWEPSMMSDAAKLQLGFL